MSIHTLQENKPLSRSIVKANSKAASTSLKLRPGHQFGLDASSSSNSPQLSPVEDGQALLDCSSYQKDEFQDSLLGLSATYHPPNVPRKVQDELGLDGDPAVSSLLDSSRTGPKGEYGQVALPSLELHTPLSSHSTSTESGNDLQNVDDPESLFKYLSEFSFGQATLKPAFSLFCISIPSRYCSSVVGTAHVT